jgi:D-3-phosphoglycerate dehydrogenase / 2-oxoglutarate reductase
MAHCLIVQPIHRVGLDRLASAGIEPRLASAANMAVVEREIVDAIAVITRNAGLNRAAMAAGRRLLVLGVHGAGVDPVDTSYAAEIGLPVVNTPGANAQSVAELAVGLMLAVARRLSAADRAVRQADIEFRYRYRFSELSGKTIGIVGFGEIGRAVASIARAAFAMRVLVYSPSIDEAMIAQAGAEKCPELEDLLMRADVVSLHSAYRRGMRPLLDRDRISRLKSTAILVNTARGGLIDEPALAEALRSGAIAGAGLDVLATEHPASDHPLMDLDNVVLSPHMGGSTEEALSRTAIAVVDQVLDALAGRRPPNLLNPAVWPRRRQPAD